MGIAVAVLASGSRGNSIYVATSRVRLLIDCGLSAKETERRLAALGLDAADLDGLILTHEHLDHIRGVGPLARRYGLPVYLSRATFAQGESLLGRLPERIELRVGKTFVVEDLTVHPFRVSHDAADPSALTLSNGKAKVGICTDLGAASKLVCHHLRGCTTLVLEANHDPEMLAAGPYPWAVKQRIRSRAGHLSNQQAAALVAEIYDEPLQHLVLAHGSQINNQPELAVRVLEEWKDRCGWRGLRVQVASQDQPLDLLRLP